MTLTHRMGYSFGLMFDFLLVSISITKNSTLENPEFLAAISDFGIHE